MKLFTVSVFLMFLPLLGYAQEGGVVAIPKSDFGRLFSSPSQRISEEEKSVPSFQQGEAEENKPASVQSAPKTHRLKSYQLFGFSTQANGKIGVWLSAGETGAMEYLELPGSRLSKDKKAINLAWEGTSIWLQPGQHINLSTRNISELYELEK